MKRVIVQMPEDDLTWLKSYSKSESKSVSQLVRELVTSKRKKDERARTPEQY